MTENKAETILKVESDVGFFEGDWPVPIAYDAGMADRLFFRGERITRHSGATIELTQEELRIVRAENKTLSIPTDTLVTVYPCDTMGNHYWRGCFLKLIYLKNNRLRMLGLAIRDESGAGAREWRQRLEERIPPARRALVADSATVERLMQDNRLISRLLWFSFLPAIIAANALLLHRFSFFAGGFVLLLLTVLGAKILYDKRRSYPGFLK
jgi:hypothetical protein